MYYKISGNNCYYSNTKKDSYYYEYTYPTGDQPKNRHVIIEDNPLYAPENASYMFAGCLDVDHLDWVNTSSSRDLSFMFYNGTADTIDVSTLSFNQARRIDYMFCGCSNLTKVIWPQGSGIFNAYYLEIMMGLFSGCRSLVTADLSFFTNTPYLKNVGHMFDGCNKLENVIWGDFSSDQITEMGRMFASCTSLKEIDLSNFGVTHLNRVDYMFGNCTNLRKITVEEDTDGEVYQAGGPDEKMFWGCTNLPNGDGVVDITRANNNKGGYFGITHHWQEYKVFMKV